ncbi:MAG TPA: Slp family lipoprotein, partial [Nitrospira sp.]|nr:Slp family lipoprotein [Nitrospira sp.]
MNGLLTRLLACSASLILVTACSTLPSKYIEKAEPGVTLTSLAAAPETYQGKTVILGGVVVD